MRFAAHLAGCTAVAAVLAGTAAGGGGGVPGFIGGSGVLARDGATRYVVLRVGADSVAAAISTRDGRVLRSRRLDGAWGIPAVAADGTAGGLAVDGRTLVLAAAPAKTSRFTVLDTRRLRVLQTVELRGRFAFDALSPDARTLYVIQHVSERDLSRYVVRALDLATQRLGSPIVDKRERESEMSGYPGCTLHDR